MQTYQGHGIQFEYPDEWEISVEAGDGTADITVGGPGNEFLVVSVMAERPEADEVIEAALESFEDEYDHVDIYDSTAQICLLPTSARDLDIVSLDMVVKSFVRACETDDATIFVLYQFTQLDDPDSPQLLEAIANSLMCEFVSDEDEPSFDAAPFKHLLPGEEI
jgi:hypothetical protein